MNYEEFWRMVQSSIGAYALDEMHPQGYDAFNAVDNAPGEWKAAAFAVLQGGPVAILEKSDQLFVGFQIKPEFIEKGGGDD